MTTTMQTTSIRELQDLKKSYGSAKILDGVSFSICPGESVCLVGPSGSCITTLLKCMAGLMEPSHGAAVFEHKLVTAPPPKMAVVFQDYSRSLLPWLSVAANVELPLRNKLSKPDRRTTVERVLQSVGLTGKGALYPWQMSGGMQQRAAIARSLAYRTDVMVMVEPFAADDG